MNPAETIKLCRLVKAVCPSQMIDTYTPDAWQLILGHLDYDDAKQAVAELAGTPLEPGQSRYIDPGHIIARVKRIRSKRIEDYGPIEPPAGEMTGREYLTWLRSALDAVASGKAPEREELPANPAGQRKVAELVASVGKPVGGAA